MPYRPDWPSFRRDPGCTAAVNDSLAFESINARQPFQLLWKQSLEGVEVRNPLVSQHGLLIVPSRSGRFAFLNRFSGEVLCSKDVPNTRDGVPSALFCGPWLILAAGAAMEAYSTRDIFRLWQEQRRFTLPAPRWEKKLPGSLVQPLALYSTARHTPEPTHVACALHTTELSVSIFRAEDGDPVKTIPNPLRWPASAIVGDGAGSLFLAADDGVVAKIAALAGPSVSASAAASLYTPAIPVCFDQRLYVTDKDGFLCSCDASDDSDLAVQRIATNGHLRLTAVGGMAANTHGLLVSHAKGLSRFSLLGTRIWHADHDANAAGGPVLLGDCAVGLFADGSLYCCRFPVSGHEVISSTPVQDKFRSALIAVDDILYYSSERGTVCAVQFDLEH